MSEARGREREREMAERESSREPKDLAAKSLGPPKEQANCAPSLAPFMLTRVRSCKAPARAKRGTSPGPEGGRVHAPK